MKKLYLIADFVDHVIETAVAVLRGEKRIRRVLFSITFRRGL